MALDAKTKMPDDTVAATTFNNHICIPNQRRLEADFQSQKSQPINGSDNGIHLQPSLP